MASNTVESGENAGQVHVFLSIYIRFGVGVTGGVICIYSKIRSISYSSSISPCVAPVESILIDMLDGVEVGPMEKLSLIVGRTVLGVDVLLLYLVVEPEISVLYTPNL